MDILKFSNAGGFTTKTRYPDMLAGNTVWNPYSPTGSYDSLASVTVPSGGTASITFSGIPSTYTHLELRYSWADTSGAEIAVQFNGDTTAGNYYRHYLQGSGASAAAGSSNNYTFGGYYGGAANQFNGSVMNILDYTNTNKYKTVRTLWGYDSNGSGYVGLTSGLWSNTAAINSITFTTNGSGVFSQYSSFALYGVK